MKYDFITEHRYQYPVRLMCELFSVSCSGFYAYTSRGPSQHELNNRKLDVKIKAIYNQHRRRYGSQWITRALKAQNDFCSQTRVARRMKAVGIKAVAKRKFKVTTDSSHNKLTYENVLSRDFISTAPNQKCVCDITYVPYR